MTTGSREIPFPSEYDQPDSRPLSCPSFFSPFFRDPHLFDSGTSPVPQQRHPAGSLIGSLEFCAGKLNVSVCLGGAKGVASSPFDPPFEVCPIAS